MTRIPKQPNVPMKYRAAWYEARRIPNNEHPFPNYDSKTCSVHQQGPVWYLPDVEPTGQVTHASVKYSCEIPKGKAIFFPL